MMERAGSRTQFAAVREDRGVFQPLDLQRPFFSSLWKKFADAAAEREGGESGVVGDGCVGGWRDPPAFAPIQSVARCFHLGVTVFSLARVGGRS